MRRRNGESSTYVSVLLRCPLGHMEVNLAEQFKGKGALCARCGGALAVVKRVRLPYDTSRARTA